MKHSNVLPYCCWVVCTLVLLFLWTGPTTHAFVTPSSLFGNSVGVRLTPPPQQQQERRQDLVVLRGAESLTPSPPPLDLEEGTKIGNQDNDDEKEGVPESQPENETDLDYHWKDQWYALTYASYVPQPSQSAETTPAAVFGQPLVVWREQDNGPIYCADDVCPHRATALTEGRIRQGRLECLYHGWQFSGQDNGACQRIPQLDATARIPQRACLRMRPCRVCEGIVWVWMGEEEPTRDPPSTGVLHDNEEEFLVYDVLIDLPYDHSYLVENLVDPAHIDISHDRTSGGGRRERAQGYDMIVDPKSVSGRGFAGYMRTLSRKEQGGPFSRTVFEAPGIIRNTFDMAHPITNITQDQLMRSKNAPKENEESSSSGEMDANKKKKQKPSLYFASALHCMPLGWRRSRLLFRVYNKGLPWMARLKFRLTPMWLRQLNACKILEQDVGLIATQEDHFHRRRGREPVQDFLLLQSSDTFVGAYRKWLDRVGHGMPWFQGLARSSRDASAGAVDTPLPPALTLAHHRASNQAVVETRYHRHVVHSPMMRRALRNIQQLKWILAGVSATTATVGVIRLVTLLASSTTTTATNAMVRTLRVCSLLAPLSLVGAVALYLLEQRFFVSFKRKDQLRTESGLIP